MPKKTAPLGVIAGWENPDKAFHHPPANPADPLSLPHPFRIILCSKPNGGKTLLAQTIAARNAPWDKIYLLHGGGNSREWDIVTHKKLDAFPAHEFWEQEGGVHTRKLLIVDDVDMLSLSSKGTPSQKSLAKSTFSHCSTHCGLSCIVTCQGITSSIPPNVRRLMSHYAYWPPNNQGDVGYMARAAMIDKHELLSLFRLCQEDHDFLLIENEGGCGRPRIHLNGAKPIY